MPLKLYLEVESQCNIITALSLLASTVLNVIAVRELS